MKENIFPQQRRVARAGPRNPESMLAGLLTHCTMYKAVVMYKHSEVSVSVSRDAHCWKAVS